MNDGLYLSNSIASTKFRNHSQQSNPLTSKHCNGHDVLAAVLEVPSVVAAVVVGPRVLQEGPVDHGVPLGDVPCRARDLDRDLGMLTNHVQGVKVNHFADPQAQCDVTGLAAVLAVFSFEVSYTSGGSVRRIIVVVVGAISTSRCSISSRSSDSTLSCTI